MNLSNRIVFRVHAVIDAAHFSRAKRDEKRKARKYIRDRFKSYGRFSLGSWWKRIEYLENVARYIPERKITPRMISILEEISRTDPEVRIKDLAKEMVASFKSKGNFSESSPAKKLSDEKRRFSIKLRTDFGYNPMDIWYRRADSLNRLLDLLNDPNRSKDLDVDLLLRDLEVIEMEDDDPNVRDAAFRILLCMRGLSVSIVTN